MKLLLVQHGHAHSKAEDPARALSGQGRQDVELITAQFRTSGVKVARVWHSGKLRAEQTAVILAKTVLPKGKPEQVDGIAPNDAVEEFISDADVWQDDTLVVGHLPFMSRLVSLLLTGNAGRDLVEYTPGSVVCLARSATGHWQLLWMLRPELLRGEVQS